MADKNRFNLRYKPVLEPERTWRSEATFQHPVRHYTETPVPSDADQPFRTDSAVDNSHNLVSDLNDLRSTLKLIPAAQELLGDTVDLLYQRLKILEIEGYHYPPSSTWWKPVNNVREKLVNPKGVSAPATGTTSVTPTRFPVTPNIGDITHGGVPSSSRPKQVQDLSVFRGTTSSSAGTYHPVQVPTFGSTDIPSIGNPEYPVTGGASIPTSEISTGVGTTSGASIGYTQSTIPATGTENPVRISGNNDTYGSGNFVTIVSSGSGGPTVTLQPDGSPATSSSLFGATVSPGSYTIPSSGSENPPVDDTGFPSINVGSGTSVTLVFGDSDPDPITSTDTQQGSPYTYDPREGVVIHDGPKTPEDSDTFITVYPTPYYPAGHDQAYTRNVTGTFMTNDKNKIGSYITESSETFEDLPALFPGTTNIELSVDTPRTLVQIVTDSYRRDQLDLTDFYLQSLKVILQTYMAPLLTLVAESGIGNLDAFSQEYDGTAVEIPDSNLQHLNDEIIRRQISRTQKLSLFKKVCNVDQTLQHMRMLHVAQKARERYYDEKYGDSTEYINSMSNSILRDSRQGYDVAYKTALYNYYKYLDASVKMTDDILADALVEAQAKAKLLQEGVQIFVTQDVVAVTHDGTTGSSSPSSDTGTSDTTVVPSIKTGDTVTLSNKSRYFENGTKTYEDFLGSKTKEEKCKELDDESTDQYVAAEDRADRDTDWKVLAKKEIVALAAAKKQMINSLPDNCKLQLVVTTKDDEITLQSVYVSNIKAEPSTQESTPMEGNNPTEEGDTADTEKPDYSTGQKRKYELRNTSRYFSNGDKTVNDLLNGKTQSQMIDYIEKQRKNYIAAVNQSNRDTEWKRTAVSEINAFCDARVTIVQGIPDPNTHCIKLQSIVTDDTITLISEYVVNIPDEALIVLHSTDPLRSTVQTLIQ